jgi:hypothetical protein
MAFAADFIALFDTYAIFITLIFRYYANSHITFDARFSPLIDDISYQAS